MNKKIIILGACLVMVTGCGTTVPKLKDGSEAVVTFKNDLKGISSEQLYEVLKENHGLGYLVNLIDKQILEDKYKDDVKEAKEYAENHMSQLEASYGDDLEAAIQQNTGLGSIEAYKESVYLGFLQNIAVEDYTKQFIKDKEVEKYYEDEIVGDIKVSHILISPKVTAEMDEDDQKKAEETAKKEAEKIIKELKDTKKADLEKKFSELAEEYSQDSTNSKNGGSLGFINKDTLNASTYGELTEKAYDLKDGEYSTKVVTTQLGYHVIMRNESKDKPELKDVKEDIVSTLVGEYLADNSTTGAEGLKELREEYGMDILDSELSSQYAILLQNQLLKPEDTQKEE